MNPLASLILVPTPLASSLPLEPIALQVLKNIDVQKDLIVVEEHREGRRRWLEWGLARAAIEHFHLLNEHSTLVDKRTLISAMKSGKKVFLLSDCGLPAFCDPGQDLVAMAHEQQLIVTATPFCNSSLLALVLSGFVSNPHLFWGFPPREKNERTLFFQQALQNPLTQILLEAPFRLEKLLAELAEFNSARVLFLVLDLNMPTETYFRGTAQEIYRRCPKDKREFVLVFSPR
jgi:16S rRNA (cytidine1402-2'-O)-methyltransferase